MRTGLLFALALVLAWTTELDAQPLGPFTWQLQPYCNAVTIYVTQNGAIYTLDGFDDQCGAVQRAPLTGLATPNPAGTISFALSIVTAPGGTPVHVAATINLGTLGGPWTDSAGHGGTLAFGARTGGSPRPPALALTPTSIQTRVTGTCPPGQLMTAVNQDGTVACQSVVGSGGGDITGVAAGTGLIGGAATGDAALAVSFGGPGSAGTVARSDHTHALANSSNTAVWDAALLTPTTGSAITAVGAFALRANTTGAANTALGTEALRVNTTGRFNTAVGQGALLSNTTADGNTAVGRFALFSNTTGFANTTVGESALVFNTVGARNTALGREALKANTTGNVNTAVGDSALTNNTTGTLNTAIGLLALPMVTTGSANIAIGNSAGTFLETGNSNIYIGEQAGSSNESNAIRIGDAFTQTTAFIAGIYAQAASGGVAVYVNSAGKLGTSSSSARFKTGIVPLGDVRDRLRALEPVQFYYALEYDDGSHLVQYGLIAEDVAETFPELLVRDAEGRPQTVRYHLLTPLLLAEVQRLERERARLDGSLAAQEQRLDTQAHELAQLRALVERLRARP